MLANYSISKGQSDSVIFLTGITVWDPQLFTYLKTLRYKQHGWVMLSPSLNKFTMYFHLIGSSRIGKINLKV